ncbi:DUF302 domain-containing protein [Thiohalobacter thiocyanaticus]|nr:DUF302 domain-containing protein [Thiohalobacter thiocyanaticus]
MQTEAGSFPTSLHRSGRILRRAMRDIHDSAARLLWATLLGATTVTTAVAQETPGTGIQVTQLAYSATMDDDITSVKDSFVSALEGRNYTIVNILDVQRALENRGIEAEPIVLVEFINLSKAYLVTTSDKRFELFAPLRAAIFGEQDGVRLLILRPKFIGDTLGQEHLSDPARAVLKEFDRDLRDVAETVRNGGF